MPKKIIGLLAISLMTLAFGVMAMMADGIYSPIHPDAMTLLMILFIFVTGYVLIDVIY